MKGFRFLTVIKFCGVALTLLVFVAWQMKDAKRSEADMKNEFITAMQRAFDDVSAVRKKGR